LSARSTWRSSAPIVSGLAGFTSSSDLVCVALEAKRQNLGDDVWLAHTSDGPLEHAGDEWASTTEVAPGSKASVLTKESNKGAQDRG
jgi:hypothetical protein